MDEKTDPQNASGFDRRSFIAGAAGSAMIPLTARAGTPAAGAMPPTQDPSLPVSATLRVNGEDKSLNIDARTTVLDALREHLGLTGSKKGCDHGQCGACTVMIEGRGVLSCLTLALSAQGRDITTIEGLSDGVRLHPMQQAFIDQDAFQCGYCTPGQIISAIACVRDGHATGDADIREYMSGNICRCAAYPNIVAAVKQAASAIMSGDHKG
jgi:xanthine dehydrogenase YagT iron-sulfur-binding subunit